MILVSSILSEPEEEPVYTLGTSGTPETEQSDFESFMQYRSVWPSGFTTKSVMIINFYALDFKIGFSLQLVYCFAQLPSQSTFSQDSELAVFAQKLKSDLVKL